MNRDNVFYLCAVCFMVSESRDECHGHWMVRCDALDLADERRRPEISPRGRIKSRAPRWFLDALRAHRAV